VEGERGGGEGGRGVRGEGERGEKEGRERGREGRGGEGEVGLSLPRLFLLAPDLTITSSGGATPGPGRSYALPLKK